MLTINQRLARDSDYCSHEGAVRLVRTISEFWKRRGRQVQVWCRRVPLLASDSDQERSIWVVESDIRLVGPTR